MVCPRRWSKRIRLKCTWRHLLTAAAWCCAGMLSLGKIRHQQEYVGVYRSPMYNRPSKGVVSLMANGRERDNTPIERNRRNELFRPDRQMPPVDHRYLPPDPRSMSPVDTVRKKPAEVDPKFKTAQFENGILFGRWSWVDFGLIGGTAAGIILFLNLAPPFPPLPAMSLSSVIPVLSGAVPTLPNMATIAGSLSAIPAPAVLSMQGSEHAESPHLAEKVTKTPVKAAKKKGDNKKSDVSNEERLREARKEVQDDKKRAAAAQQQLREDRYNAKLLESQASEAAAREARIEAEVKLSEAEADMQRQKADAEAMAKKLGVERSENEKIFRETVEVREREVEAAKAELREAQQEADLANKKFRSMSFEDTYGDLKFKTRAKSYAFYNHPS